MTPRQLDALVIRHQRKTRAQEFLFGQLTSWVINSSMGRPKEPFSPKDFMPSEWKALPAPEQPKAKVPKRKRDIIALELRSNMDAYMRRGFG
jgi:hypothetical protein